jgi:hypothetical protein
MKFVLLTLASLAWSTAARSVAKTTGPVEKVIDLLKELHDQLNQDEKVESKMYNKYACWCESATSKKAAAIESAKEQLRETSQLILTLKGEIATLEAEIKKLEADLEANAKQQEEATAMRAKQNEEYIAFTTETKQAMVALEKAIYVLIEGATKDPAAKEGAALLQTRSREVVKNVVESLPSSANIKADQMAFLSEFLTGKSKYTPQSMTVQGILKDMYETFASDVESSTLTEAKQNRNFETLIADLIEQANQWKKMKAEKEETKAEKEVALADATQLYDEVKEQMEADIEFFDATKEACEAKHDEWTERSRLRQEEIAGIKEAIDTISSDEARELLGKAITEGKEVNADSKYDTGVSIAPAFLQESQQPSFKAYKALKSKATKTKSLRLAALAARVHEAKTGHFDVVIGEIDKMIQTLNSEGAADVAKRDQCKKEIQDANSTILDLEWKIQCNEAAIAKLERKIQDTQDEIQATADEIEVAKEYKKHIKAVREEENSKFLEEKKTDQEAIELLKKVRDVLSAYYKKNDIDMGPVQGAVKGLELAQKKQGPAFERSEFDAPDATFSKKSKRSTEAKDVVSILTMVIEDLNDEIKNSMKAEEDAQLAYEAQVKAADLLITKLKAKKIFLESVKAKAMKDKDDETSTMNENKVLLEDEDKYLNGILPDCQWVYKSFEERADRRAAEMEGLTTAKAYLAGYNPNQDSVGYLEDEGANRYNTAFAQMPKRFDDSALSKIQFQLRR